MFTEPIIVREASNNDKDFPYCNVALCDFPDPFNVEELSLLNWKPLCSGDKLDPKFHSFYQKEYLRNWNISCVDPISGEIVNADFGYFFPIGWGGIIYKFSGSCTFYLLTSYFEQSKLALFIEEKNTLILSGLCSSLTVELFNAWSSSLNKINPDSIYFNRNPVLFLGFVKNLGHFIWNELSGLESVVNDGLLPKVSEIQLGPYDYLPLQKIFPEFSDYEIKILKYDSLQSSCAFHFPLRVTGNRVSRSLRRRLMSYALSEVGEKWRSVIGENKSKCIWINLRAHNKSWLNQEIHLTNIIQVICFNFGFDVLFILDGTPDSGGIASNLISSMPGKKIIDATNVSIEDSIFLSMGIDFHLSVVGSGLVIPNWVAGRRGIAHSNRIHLRQQTWWNNVAIGSKDVKFIDECFIRDLDYPTTPNIMYVNYEIDINALLAETLSILRQCDELLRWSMFQKMMKTYDVTGNPIAAVEFILDI